MYRSFTRLLLKPLNLQAATYALISQLTLVCNMQLNVLDDLAEAMKALDRKKRVATNFLFVVLRGSFLLLLLFGVFGVVAVFFFALVSWVRAVCSISPRFPPSLPTPLGLSSVPSGPVSALLVPPSGYLVVSATVRLSYLRYGVLWLIGSCLHSSSWQQRLRPCVGLCPLHHVVGVVQVPLAPALRYSPLGDPETP